MSSPIVERNLTRRESLRCLGAAALGVAAASTLVEAAADAQKKSAMGLVSYCVGLRRKLQTANGSADDLYAPLPLLRHCAEANVGGMQTSLGVLEAENGLHALALIERTRPNLVICDLMMPEMDGFKFLGEFRRRPEWASIPVVVLSAKTLNDAERHFLTTH